LSGHSFGGLLPELAGMSSEVVLGIAFEGI
jgi:hypothetical protein